MRSRRPAKSWLEQERMRILSQEEAVVLESRQIGDVVGTCQGLDIRKERKGRIRDFLVFKFEQLGECSGCG